MQTFLSVVFKYEEKINTLLEINLETGRTHQIRVHLSHIGYPIIDDLYKQKGKLIMRKKEISMIILAGGASSRMGRDKSDLTIDGKTFLEMQIEKGEKLGISDILLSGYHGENKYKYPIIPDRFPGKGPLGGLEACFRKAKNPYCLVLGVDVPLVPAEELAALIRQSLHSDAKAVILSHGGHEEPLMGVYRTDLADAMFEEITLRKGAVFAFLRRNGYECYESQVPDRYFSNINDPEMYSKIQTTEMSLKK